jgi:acyl carrier protein
MTLTENQGRVIEVLMDVFKSKGLSSPPLAPETVLDQLGLESLDFAQAVIRLEEITGKDPFATGTEYQIRTLSDLAVLYD